MPKVPGYNGLDKDHSMRVPQWMWDWGISNDPKKRKNAVPYLRECLGAYIMEHRAGGETSSTIEPRESQSELSESAAGILDLLQADGLELIRPPSTRTTKAWKDGPCIITELLSYETGDEPRNMNGRLVCWARFRRTETGHEFNAPVDPIWKKALREVYNENL